MEPRTGERNLSIVIAERDPLDLTDLSWLAPARLRKATASWCF